MPVLGHPGSAGGPVVSAVEPLDLEPQVLGGKPFHQSLAQAPT